MNWEGKKNINSSRGVRRNKCMMMTIIELNACCECMWRFELSALNSLCIILVWSYQLWENFWFVQMSGFHVLTASKSSLHICLFLIEKTKKIEISRNIEKKGWRQNQQQLLFTLTGLQDDDGTGHWLCIGRLFTLYDWR